MDKIKVVALGGLDEEGKDLYVIEINNNIFVVNAGFKHPGKTAPGIDFIIADFSYLVENKDRVKAYILTKSKINNFGGIPYIYQKVPAPIYCTNLTRLFLIEFSKEYMQEVNYDFKIVTLPSLIKICGFDFHLFSTCSSMPSTFGFSIETSEGNIVYCGDFIVEYSNEKYFNLDLNTLGKIAEKPILLLLSDSLNSTSSGYCSPNHRLFPQLKNYFKAANGRIFVVLSSENLYHFNEFFKLCSEMNKKVCLYDETSKRIYDLRKFSDNDFYNAKNIVTIDNILRIKEDELVILISDQNEKMYEKLTMLANGDNEEKQIKITPNDTFILGFAPSDRFEVMATSIVDEIYKTGCTVRYFKKKTLARMHAYEEDLKMVISLLKPKYYVPIQGYYVNLLANAQVAFDMHFGLSHNNIFLLDNGQSFNYKNGEVSIDYNLNNEIKIGDVMIDGIGVGDVVNEIITQRSRLSEDGVIIIGCGVSKSKREIVYRTDIQMRGFLFLKDKEAEGMSKEISRIFAEELEIWLEKTQDFNTKTFATVFENRAHGYLMYTSNRSPVIKLSIVVVD